MTVELPNPSHLVLLAELYAEDRNIRLTALSSRIFGESKKLALLRGGTDLTTRRYAAAVQWFSDNWPFGLPWPHNVPRPQVAA